MVCIDYINYIDTIKIMIDSLVRVFPEWIKILEHSIHGVMLKIDKNVKLNIILKKLQDIKELE